MIETGMVTAIVLVASTAQTVAGFGFALIGMPLLMNVIGVRDAVVLITLASVVNTALVAQRSRAVVPWRRVSGMLSGCAAGLPVGLAVLLLAPEDVLRVVVGTTTVAMALVLAVVQQTPVPVRLRNPEVPAALAALAICGAANTRPMATASGVARFPQSEAGATFPQALFIPSPESFFIYCCSVFLGVG